MEGQASKFTHWLCALVMQLVSYEHLSKTLRQISNSPEQVQ